MKKLIATLITLVLLASCSPANNTIKAGNPAKVTSQTSLGAVEIYTIEQEGCKFAIVRDYHGISIAPYGKCKIGK